MAKKLFALLCAAACLLAAGCGSSSGGCKEVLSDGLVVFPGTEWNMTPEEVMAALSLTEEDLAEEASDDWQYAFLVRDMAVFGLPADVVYNFGDASYSFRDNGYTGEPVFGLRAVQVNFPEDADMDAVRLSLEKALGEPGEAREGTYTARWSGRRKLCEFQSEEMLHYMEERYRNRPEGLDSETQIKMLYDAPASELYLVAAPDDWTGIICIDSRFFHGNALVFRSSIPYAVQTDHVLQSLGKYKSA